MLLLLRPNLNLELKPFGSSSRATAVLLLQCFEGARARVVKPSLSTERGTEASDLLFRRLGPAGIRASFDLCDRLLKLGTTSRGRLKFPPQER